MDYSFFAAQAALQDNRNIFKKYDGELSSVPEALKSFYRNCNPVDVEVRCDGGAVCFAPVEELASLQSEYSHINAPFIFATSNGDPIFLKEGHVYTCPHGVKNPQWELLSDDFETYLSSLI